MPATTSEHFGGPMEDADGEFLRTRVLDLATLLIAMKARTEVREACRASLGETRRKSWALRARTMWLIL